MLSVPGFQHLLGNMDGSPSKQGAQWSKSKPHPKWAHKVTLRGMLVHNMPLDYNNFWNLSSYYSSPPFSFERTTNLEDFL